MKDNLDYADFISLRQGAGQILQKRSVWLVERVTSEELAQLELLLIGILFTPGGGWSFPAWHGAKLLYQWELEASFAEKISVHDTG